MFKSIFFELNKLLKNSQIRYDVEMKNLTSIKIGGAPAALITIDDQTDIQVIIEYCNKNGFTVIFIGKGTNLIFSDKLNKYVILRFGERFARLKIEEDLFVCGCGTPLPQAVRKSGEVGLSGLEWAMGIPGSVGGAIVNNSGANDDFINSKVENIKAVDEKGKEKVLKSNDIKPEYRTTLVKSEKKFILTEVSFRLKKKNRLEILEDLNKYFLEKQKVQPLNDFSAGCIFKNPNGLSAGKIIDECGYKGVLEGGVKVSEKHANFIINFNNASFEDFRILVNRIKETVLKKFNIEFELEVEIIGGDL